MNGIYVSFRYFDARRDATIGPMIEYSEVRVRGILDPSVELFIFLSIICSSDFFLQFSGTPSFRNGKYFMLGEKGHMRGS